MVEASTLETHEHVVAGVARIRHQGVRVWSEQGRLRYEAPKGALTMADLQWLRSRKADVIAHLEATDASSSEAEPASLRSGRLPLTFSQLSHWQWFGLGERKHLRQIASATRIRGRLDLTTLRHSVEVIERRHDALRIRIVDVDGIPFQEVAAAGSCALEIIDLTGCAPELHEAELARQIKQFILQPVSVTSDPLLALRILRFGDDEHVLLAAMEHIISDMFSLGLLLRDLFTAYSDMVQGRALSLPDIALQFTDHAIQQNATHLTWLQRHGTYWREHLRDCGRVRFPADDHVPANAANGWDVLPIKVCGELKQQLRDWCRMHRTTLAMSMFAAYSALALRWCNTSQMVIQYVTDGRVDPRLHNTIGAFGYLMSLRIELRPGGSFIDLLQQVTEEYCSAQENADAGYVEAQEPRPEVLRNTAFNWLPQGSVSWGRQGSTAGMSELEHSPVPFAHPMLSILDWDREPFVLLFETDEDISGDIYFPTHRFSPRTIQRFVRNLAWFVERLIKQPATPVRDILLV